MEKRTRAELAEIRKKLSEVTGRGPVGEWVHRIAEIARVAEINLTRINWNAAISAIIFALVEEASHGHQIDLLEQEIKRRLQADVGVEEDGDRKPIIIEFEGIKYECPSEVYDSERVVLPDGRVLKINGWMETVPPKPADIVVVDKILVARRMG